MKQAPKKHKGALAELKAASFLLSQGFEVFRNVSAHGLVDLIALDPETQQTTLYDVKTTVGGNYIQTLRKRANPGIKLIIYDPTEDLCVIDKLSAG